MITLQFGPWAPDQSDTPVQVPDTQGPLMVPLADLLNVFFQNGSYRSIQSPAVSTINGVPIAALNTQALSAFSYFDNVAQQETVFVGTSTGIQQLTPAGTWSNVPFISAQALSLIGASMTFGAGSFVNTNALKGASMSFTSGVISQVVTGISFVSGAYFAGATSYNGVNRQGHSGSLPGFGTVNFANVSFGTFQSLMDVTAQGSFLIVGTATNPGQSAFTTIVSNGITQTSAAAAYFYDATAQQATWEFPVAFGFSQGTTYQVTLA